MKERCRKVEFSMHWIASPDRFGYPPHPDLLRDWKGDCDFILSCFCIRDYVVVESLCYA